MDEKKKNGRFKGIDSWLLKQKTENVGRKARFNLETPLLSTQSMLDLHPIYQTAKSNPKPKQNMAIQSWKSEKSESTPSWSIVKRKKAKPAAAGQQKPNERMKIDGKQEAEPMQVDVQGWRDLLKPQVQKKHKVR